jgi:hypothetical protein
MVYHKTLKETGFTEIYETMLTAFSDFPLDMTYMQEHHLYNRAIKNGVDFKALVGMFDKDNPVVFTLVGIDEGMGEKAVFDIVTGIIEDYRGKGYAREILFNLGHFTYYLFDLLYKELKDGGIIWSACLSSTNRKNLQMGLETQE